MTTSSLLPFTAKLARIDGRRRLDGVSDEHTKYRLRLTGPNGETIDGWMSAEAVAELVTGGTVDVGLRIVNFDRLGKVRETKKVHLRDMPRLHGLTRSQIQGPVGDAALAEYEIDGWAADRSNILNHHRKGWVSFTRYVDPQPAAEE